MERERMDENNTKIIFVRHGETDWNQMRRFQGNTDIPLNAIGRLQAGYAREGLRDQHIDACYSSPLKRAEETAEIICAPHGILAEPVWDLREQELGEWEGMLAAEIEEQYPGLLRLWRNAPGKLKIPGGETFEQVRQRGTAAFWKVTKENPGKTILLVSHMVCISIILSDLAGLDYNTIWDRPIGNAAWCTVEAGWEHRAEIVEWDHEEHIPEEKRTTVRLKR